MVFLITGKSSRYSVDYSFIKSPKLERRVLLTGGNVAMVTDYATRITINSGGSGGRVRGVRTPLSDPTLTTLRLNLNSKPALP